MTVQYLPADQLGSAAQLAAVDGQALPASQHTHDIQTMPAGGDHSAGSHTSRNAQDCVAPGISLPADHAASSTHTETVGGEDLSAGDHRPPDTQRATVPGGIAAIRLGIYADHLDDLEGVRIDTDNRIRALRQVKGLAGSPEEARFQKMSDAMAALEHQAELDLKRALRQHPLGPWVARTVGVGEKQGARLIATLRDPYIRSDTGEPRTVSQLWALCGLHVLHPGQAQVDNHYDTAGVEPSDTAAHPRVDTHTLLDGGVISGPDQPAANTQKPAVRATLCDPAQTSYDIHKGAGGVAARRTKGVQANWNPKARSRVWLIATSCIKQAHSPYRAVYDAARAKYAYAVHDIGCTGTNMIVPDVGPRRVYCKTDTGERAGKGDPLGAGHQHARAIRIVMKAILKDLWLEARDLHAAGTP